MRKSLFYLSLIVVFELVFASPFSVVLAQDSPINFQIISVDSESFPRVKTYFSLSDPQGFPITGLDMNVFSLSEDNKPIPDATLTQIKNTEMALAVVLVLDTSGSMASTLSTSIAAAKDFIGTLGPNDQVSLITFTGKPTIVQDFTTDRLVLTQALDGLKAGGDSALFDTIVEAIDLLKPRAERKVILLITDGYESGISSYSLGQVIDEAARWSTPIYPIGFGGVHRDKVEKLAKLTGGFAQINPDATALSDSLSNVLNNLRDQYVLEYTSTLVADGKEHEVNIVYDYQSGSVSDSQRFIAKPGEVLVVFNDLGEGQEISGQVRFSPNILAPASIRSLEIRVDQKELTSILAEPFEYVWDSSSVTPGVHRFDFIVTDSIGNFTTQTLNLNVVPPVRVTTSLVSEQNVTGKLTVPVGVEASRGVAKVEFFIDGKKTAEDIEAPFEFVWDTTASRPGYHDIRFLATDLEQNTGEQQLKVNVEIQKNNNLLWIALVTLLVAFGVILPISMRKNKNARKSPGQIGNSPGGYVGSAKLIEKAGLTPDYIWPLRSSETRLGRKRDENDIPLKGLSASRYHAVILLSPEGYELRNLNPENPTFVNGIPIPDRIILKHGDIIRAGESEFWYEG
ncbi:MAG: VWA domain-containing protein [Anaerolineaceae bacterium]